MLAFRLGAQSAGLSIIEQHDLLPYLPAATHTMQRTTSSGTGAIVDSQDWVFAAATGEHLEYDVKFGFRRRAILDKLAAVPHSPATSSV